MAMTFSSKECYQTATDLNTTASKLNTILNTNLAEIMQDAKENYRSDTAEQVYVAYNKMQAQFDNFVNAITACSTELREVVAPYIENVESAAASKVGL